MVIGIIVLVAGMGYGGWQLERWFHYKFSYKDQVEDQILQQLSPLQIRIMNLEREVSNLKTNR